MATLPTPRRHSAGGGRRRVPGGLTSGDIPDVNLPRDPGFSTVGSVPGAFGEIEAQGLQDLGDGMINAGRNLRRRQARVDAARAKMRDAREANAAMLGLLKYDSETNHAIKTAVKIEPQQVNKEYAEVINSLAAGISDPETQQQFRFNAGRAMIGTHANALAKEHSIMFDENLAIAEGMERATLEEFSQNPEKLRDGGSRIRAENAVEGLYKETMVELGMEPSVANERFERYKKNISLVEYQQDRLQVINVGETEDLKVMLSRIANGSYPGIDPDKRPRAMESLTRDYANLKEAQEKKASSVLHGFQTSNYLERLQRIPGQNLTLNIDTGETEPDYTFDELQRDLANNMISDKDAEKLTKYLNARKKETIELTVLDSDPEVSLELEEMIVLQSQDSDFILSRIREENLNGNLTNEERIRLTEKQQRFVREGQNSENSQLSRDIKTAVQFVKSRTLVTFGPMGQFSKAEEHRQFIDMSNLVEARLRAGDRLTDVLSDIEGRIDEKGILSISEGKAALDEAIVSTKSYNHPRYDVSRYRLFLHKRQQSRIEEDRQMEEFRQLRNRFHGRADANGQVGSELSPVEEERLRRLASQLKVPID